LPQRIRRPRVVPPEALFIGLARGAALRALREGLKPNGRRHVHLSVSLEEAWRVAWRRGDCPVMVLEVLAAEAHQDGHAFYAAGPLYLAHAIPSRFVRQAAVPAEWEARCEEQSAPRGPRGRGGTTRARSARRE